MVYKYTWKWENSGRECTFKNPEGFYRLKKSTPAWAEMLNSRLKGRLAGSMFEFGYFGRGQCWDPADGTHPFSSHL